MRNCNSRLRTNLQPQAFPNIVSKQLLKERAWWLVGCHMVVGGRLQTQAPLTLIIFKGCYRQGCYAESPASKYSENILHLTNYLCIWCMCLFFSSFCPSLFPVSPYSFTQPAIIWRVPIRPWSCLRFLPEKRESFLPCSRCKSNWIVRGLATYVLRMSERHRGTWSHFRWAGGFYEWFGTWSQLRLLRVGEMSCKGLVLVICY